MPHLSGLLRRRKGGVVFLLGDDGLLALDVLLLELWQEALPVFLFQGWVFGQFPLDHERLDVVNRVHILYAIFHHTPHLSHCTP